MAVIKIKQQIVEGWQPFENKRFYASCANGWPCINKS